MQSIHEQNNWKPRMSGPIPDWMIDKYVGIEPFADRENRPGKVSFGLGSYGYDARLDEYFKFYSPTGGFPVVDVKRIDPKAYVPGIVETDSYGDRFCLLPPHSYVLGETLETFDIPRDVIVITLGKSTYARAGVIVNTTPAEPEWKGKLTLEICNSSCLPVKLYVGEGICQFIFFLGAADCEVSYADKKGVYQNQKEVTLPKVAQ